MIKYSPVNEDSAVERIEFYKDNTKITLVNRFDTYAVYIDEEEGERIEFSVEGDLTKKEKDKIISAFQEMYESGVEELGWEWSDRELWYFGPINREEE